jgi:SAM-dependent methyltransferase
LIAVDAKAYRQFLELERDHWWFRGRRTVYFGLLRQALADHPPQRILDLGCGMGGFLDGLQDLGQRVYHSDIDLSSLRHCTRRGHPHGVVSSGYALPFRDGAFDLVCLFDAIEHIPDDRRAMAEVARILRPGGRVFVSVPAYQFLYANNDRVAQHQRRYTRAGLRRLFEGAGLEVVRNTHSNVFLFPVILPAVLGLKVLERVWQREQDPDHTNLSWPIPRFVHDLCHRAFAAELPFSRRFDWPVGHSIAALASKPAGRES